MLNRAYSLLEIKSVDDEQRVITGIATSSSPDRVNDIVEPKGAIFQLPIPLLWQHDAKQPIGEVFAAKQVGDGIEIQARIAKTDQAGELKNRLDLAWQSITMKLVRGLSIGFKSLEETYDKSTGGFRFVKWLWLELSAVTIPANADATILNVKSHDVGAPAATGTGHRVSSQPGASGSVVFAARKGAPSMKPITDQIAAFEATRAADEARMSAIISKAADEGRTLDEAEKEEHDTLVGKVKDVDDHLVRLRAHEERSKQQAKQVTGNGLEDGTNSRGTTRTVSVQSNLPPGIEFTRMVMCKIASFLEMQKGNFVSAEQIARSRYPDCPRIHNVLKATVGAGVTEVAGSPGTDFAASLVYQQNLENEFVEFLRPQTIIGRIQGLRRVPFNIRYNAQTSSGTGYWVGEGAAKPLTSMGVTPNTLLWAKVAAISVITQELARFSSPSAEQMVRDDLSAAIIERMDIDFVDPNKGLVSGVSPASITNGITPISSSGTEASAVRTDLQALFAAFIADNLNPATATLIMPTATAMAISLMQNALGQRQFPDISMQGGTLMGVPVVTSQYVTDGSPGGAMIILVNARDIFLADDGQVTVDVSREASLEMSDAPSGNSATGTGAQLVSMFQTNSIALRAERFVNWARRREEAVQYLTGVAYSATGSPS